MRLGPLSLSASQQWPGKNFTSLVPSSRICGNLIVYKMISRVHSTRTCALFLVSLFGAPVLFAQPSVGSGATITFRKVFKSSFPEFVEIKVAGNGACTADIRQLSDDPSPQPFQLSQPVVQRIFQLAGDLHDFNGVNLEIHRRVANLGEKTFIYQNGSQVYQTTFNYSTNQSAIQILNLFENLTRQEMDISDLKRTMRYDKLGVYDVVQRVQQDYEQKVLPDPAQLLPTLDQLARDNTLLDIARERARTLAGRIRNGH